MNFYFTAATRRPYPRARMQIARCVLAVGILLAACGRVPPASPSDNTIRVVSYNIRHGRGADDSLDLVRTANVLRAQGADIIGLQEVDDRVQRSRSVAEADSLGRLLGMNAAFGAFFDYQGGQYGMALLSRFPIVGIHPVRLPDGNEPRIALLTRVAMPQGDTISVINVHFDWVSNDSFRFAQATALTRTLDTLSTPYILLGDFNDVPDSRTLALFRSRAVEARKPRDNHLTFPSDVPVKEIDYIFVAPAARWDIGDVRVVDERVASDHRAVRAELRRR